MIACISLCYFGFAKFRTNYVEAETHAVLTNHREDICFRPMRGKSWRYFSRARHQLSPWCLAVSYIRYAGNDKLTWPFLESSWLLWLDNRNRKVFGSPTNLHQMLTILVGFVVQKLKRISRIPENPLCFPKLLKHEEHIFKIIHIASD